MPSAAATVAGRRSDRPAAAGRAPKPPRRVSGPSSGLEGRAEPRQRARPDVRPSGRAAAAAVAVESQLAPTPARPRRERPAGRPARPDPVRERATTTRRGRGETQPRLALRLRAPRLDRIVRGRAWIPALGALLVAIVGLRVEVLKLGAGVGSEVQQATALQSSNAQLRAQISALSDNERIARLAAAYGMRMPNALDPHFLQASAGDHVGAAIRNISSPDRQVFLTSLATEEHSDQLTAQAGSALSAVGGTPNPTASLSSGVGAVSGTAAGGSSSAGASTSTAGSGATGSVSTGAAASASTSAAGSVSTSATSAATSGTSGTGATASQLSGSSTGATAMSPPTDAAGTGAPSVAGTSTSPAASTDQATGSTSGGTGLAG